MKIVSIAIWLSVLFSSPAFAGYNSPEQVTTAFLEEQLRQFDDGKHYNAKNDKPFYKMIYQKEFKAMGVDISQYSPNFWLFDDYSMKTIDKKAGLVKVIIFSHRHQNANELIFRAVKESGSYRLVPSNIQPLNRGTTDKLSFDPNQQYKHIKYSYHGEPTTHPPRFVGLPKPLSFVFMKTTESEATDSLTKMDVKVTNSGFRIIGNTTATNPDIRGVFFSDMTDMNSLVLWFFQGKLFSLSYNLKGDFNEHLQSFRKKYGNSQASPTKGKHQWDWSENQEKTPVNDLHLYVELHDGITYVRYELTNHNLRQSDDESLKRR